MSQVTKITPALSLVIPLDIPAPDGKGPGKVHYIYSRPLPHAVFKAHWLVFSKTFAQVYTEGLHLLAGPRITAMAMRDIAAKMGVAEEIELGVFAEINRLSYLVYPQEGKGWQQIMLHDAVAGNLISPEDYEEVENILAFFTVTSAMHRAAERRVILEGAAKLWDAQITSYACSEFIASLPKLTVTASSGGTQIRVA